jgi:outer membrane protein assembly factor BamB
VVACTPHSGLGTVTVRHVEVNLATCRTSPAPPARSTSGPREVGTTIVFHGKVVVRARKGDAVALDGTSPDGRWVLYAIDRFASASLAADGLPVRAVGAAGGRSYPIATGLVYASYRSWCDGRLVMTAGFDRDATTHKWLITSSPPAWGSRVLVEDAARAFGSLTCASDGIVVQSTTASPEGYRSPHWSLWHVAWNGKLERLTSPPARVSDESPQDVGGVLYFVRSGSLYALRGRRLFGPLLRVPRRQPQYFGHTDWLYTVRR